MALNGPQILAIMTLLGTGYIAYRSRIDAVGTEYQTQSQLNDLLRDASVANQNYGLTIDNISFEEDSGIRYQFTKAVFGKIQGKTHVTVQWEFPEEGDPNKFSNFLQEFWESEISEIAVESYSFDNVSHEITKLQGTSLVASTICFRTTDENIIIDYLEKVALAYRQWALSTGNVSYEIGD